MRVLINRVSIYVVRTLCSVAFSAIIVAVSKQDSDTRYVRREKRIEPGDTVRRYLRQLDATIPTVREMSNLVDDRYSCQLLTANLLDAPETKPFELVVTSPPIRMPTATIFITEVACYG